MSWMADGVGRLLAHYLEKPAQGYEPFTPSDPETLRATLMPGDVLLVEGSIYGALTVASGAVLNVGGSGTLNLYGALTNAGTVVVTNTDYVRLWYSPPASYGAIYNLPGALFDIQNDQFYLWTAYGTEFFNNAGTLRKSAGSGTTVIDPIINNTGTVDAETGTLSFHGGGTIDGQRSEER